VKRLKIVISLIVTISLAVSSKAAPQSAMAEPPRQSPGIAPQPQVEETGLGRDKAMIVSLGGLIARYNQRLSLDETVTLIQAVLEASEEYQLDPLLVASVIAAESSFHPRARSRCGAEGLMQLTEPLQPWVGVSDPYDIRQNIAGGCKYLHGLQKRFGRIELVLAAYNAGPTRVARLGRVPDIRETICYVSRVTKLQVRLNAEMKKSMEDRAFRPVLAPSFLDPPEGDAPLPVAKPEEKPDRWLIASLVQGEGVMSRPSPQAVSKPGVSIGKRRGGVQKAMPLASTAEPGGALNGIAQSLLIARADQDGAAPNREEFLGPVAVPGEYEQMAEPVDLESYEKAGEREVYLAPVEDCSSSEA